ncbi:MAG TPA: DUF1343 domain-containing protein, partial [Caldithrix abyssi]|nr:DUF1343 domain-containing protein [Caldithrix abyssi]
MKKFLLLIFLVLMLSGCRMNRTSAKVATGLDRVPEYARWFKGKRVGIITNHTAYTSDGRYIVDVFLNLPQVQVKALFGPEHGIRGQMDAGKKIDAANDRLAGIPIYSLYGKHRKPTPEMVKDIDALVFDIQDIG